MRTKSNTLVFDIIIVGIVIAVIALCIIGVLSETISTDGAFFLSGLMLVVAAWALR